MSIMTTKQLFPEHCSSLCGRHASGDLKITSKTSLPICQTCRQIIDPDAKYQFINFDESEKETDTKTKIKTKNVIIEGDDAI